MPTSTPPVGGSFLVEAATPDAIFTPERLTTEHRAVRCMVDEFWAQEVAPALDAILSKRPGAAREVIRKSAALGLTALHVPERYGGADLDLPSVMIAIESLSRDQSYLGWHLGHAGIGTLPLVLYGTDAQKAKYLPKLIAVDLLAAYALTEPDAGSDALAARTTAHLSPDGRHYVLNGQKMWITNGGEADLFTVFAKVDGEAFTAFLVERGFGVTSGAEERKMGLAGTSTTALYLDQVKVPVENVLGDVGRGHVIALNVLNVGRLELGPNMLAGARNVLEASLRHAAGRQAFGGPLASLGAIRHMLADCVVRMFASESATWRAVGLVEAEASRRIAGGSTCEAGWVAAFEEFAAECSIVKVLASEMLGVVADHGVQIHGGYGYHRDYAVERIYRDARINRIFEGTNEINRLVVPGLIRRRLERAGRAGPALVPRSIPTAAPTTVAATPAAIVANLRTLTCWLFAAVRDRSGDALREPQELVMALSDLIIETFTAEAVWRRSEALAGTAGEALAARIAQVHLHDARARAAVTATTMAPALFGVDARAAIDAARALTDAAPCDTIALRRSIAAAAIEHGRYERLFSG